MVGAAQTGLIWSAEVDPDGTVAAFDPYSAWSLLYARRFDFAAMEQRLDHKDFTYQIGVENHVTTDIEPLPPVTSPDGCTDVVGALAHSDDGATGSTLVYLSPDDGAFNQLAITPCATDAPTDIPDTEDTNSATRSSQKVRFRAPLRAASIAKTTQPRTVTSNGLTRDIATVVGVIDEGINLIHDRFTYAGAAAASPESRIDFAWIMDGVAQNAGAVPFGREYTSADLSPLVANRHRSDEAKLRDLGLIDFARPEQRTVAQTLAHGTHVADLAAGYPPASAKRDARIVAVQLPSLVTRETSGAWLSPFAIAAASYILDRAYDMSLAEGFAIPVVINFSYSIAASAHNGQHFVERGLDVLLTAHRKRMTDAFPAQPARCKAEIVIPSGNRALARGHAEIVASQTGQRCTLSLPWRVQPADHSANFLELWVPVTASKLRISVTPPNGTPTPLRGLRANQALVLHQAGATGPDDILARVTLDRQRKPCPSGTQRKKRVLIAIAPTALPFAIDRARAPAGLWQVSLSADMANAGDRIEAWIQRDDTPIGFSRAGRPSYFDDPVYERFQRPSGDINTQDTGPSVVKRAGALSGIVTGAQTTVVGAYQGPPTAGLAAIYAGRTNGAADLDMTTDPPTIRAPGQAAQSDRSRVLQGVRAAGTRSGSRGVMNGSSVAAPQWTRYIAENWLGLPIVAPLPVAPPHPQLGTRALMAPPI